MHEKVKGKKKEFFIIRNKKIQKVQQNNDIDEDETEINQKNIFENQKIGQCKFDPQDKNMKNYHFIGNMEEIRIKYKDQLFKNKYQDLTKDRLLKFRKSVVKDKEQDMNYKKYLYKKIFTENYNGKSVFQHISAQTQRQKSIETQVQPTEIIFESPKNKPQKQRISIQRSVQSQYDENYWTQIKRQVSCQLESLKAEYEKPEKVKVAWKENLRSQQSLKKLKFIDLNNIHVQRYKSMLLKKKFESESDIIKSINLNKKIDSSFKEYLQDYLALHQFTTDAQQLTI